MILIDAIGPAGSGKSTVLGMIEDERILKYDRLSLSKIRFAANLITTLAFITDLPRVLIAMLLSGSKRPFYRTFGMLAFLYQLENLKDDEIVLVEFSPFSTLRRNSYKNNSAYGRKIERMLRKRYDYAIIYFYCSPENQLKRIRKRESMIGKRILEDKDPLKRLNESQKRSKSIIEGIKDELFFYGEVKTEGPLKHQANEMRKHIDEIIQKR